jgi:hypothetical protein
MGIVALLKSYYGRAPEAGKAFVRQKNPEGRLIWNSAIKGTYIRAKHGEIGSKKHD